MLSFLYRTLSLRRRICPSRSLRLPSPRSRWHPRVSLGVEELGNRMLPVVTFAVDTAASCNSSSSMAGTLSRERLLQSQPVARQIDQPYGVIRGFPQAFL
jgi:hypothetical protein